MTRRSADISTTGETLDPSTVILDLSAALHGLSTVILGPSVDMDGPSPVILDPSADMHGPSPVILGPRAEDPPNGKTPFFGPSERAFGPERQPYRNLPL